MYKKNNIKISLAIVMALSIFSLNINALKNEKNPAKQDVLKKSFENKKSKNNIFEKLNSNNEKLKRSNSIKNMKNNLTLKKDETENNKKNLKNPSTEDQTNLCKKIEELKTKENNNYNELKDIDKKIKEIENSNKIETLKKKYVNLFKKNKNNLKNEFEKIIKKLNNQIKNFLQLSEKLNDFYLLKEEYIKQLKNIQNKIEKKMYKTNYSKIKNAIKQKKRKSIFEIKQLKKENIKLYYLKKKVDNKLNETRKTVDALQYMLDKNIPYEEKGNVENLKIELEKLKKQKNKLEEKEKLNEQIKISQPKIYSYDEKVNNKTKQKKINRRESCKKKFEKAFKKYKRYNKKLNNTIKPFSEINGKINYSLKKRLEHINETLDKNILKELEKKSLIEETEKKYNKYNEIKKEIEMQKEVVDSIFGEINNYIEKIENNNINKVNQKRNPYLKDQIKNMNFKKLILIYNQLISLKSKLKNLKHSSTITNIRNDCKVIDSLQKEIKDAYYDYKEKLLSL